MYVPSSSNVVFYPIGNTPAVNLLAYHLPTNNNDAATEILLLACGDPRSILYSLWSEGKPGNNMLGHGVDACSANSFHCRRGRKVQFHVLRSRAGRIRYDDALNERRGRRERVLTALSPQCPLILTHVR